jgi:hypothetical protein
MMIIASGASPGDVEEQSRSQGRVEVREEVVANRMGVIVIAGGHIQSSKTPEQQIHHCHEAVGPYDGREESVWGVVSEGTGGIQQ